MTRTDHMFELIVRQLECPIPVPSRRTPPASLTSSGSSINNNNGIISYESMPQGNDALSSRVSYSVLSSQPASVGVQPAVASGYVHQSAFVSGPLNRHAMDPSIQSMSHSNSFSSLASGMTGNNAISVMKAESGGTPLYPDNYVSQAFQEQVVSTQVRVLDSQDVFPMPQFTNSVSRQPVGHGTATFVRTSSDPSYRQHGTSSSRRLM